MELGFLLLHITVGLLFVGHGAQKLFGALGGAGLEGTADSFESMGLRPGKVHGVTAGLGEFAGGVLLTLGLLVPVAAMLITATMVAAIATVHGPKGPWNTEGGWELNATYIVVVLALAGAGAGDWSLDAVLGLDVAGTGWLLAAAGAGLAGGAGAVVSGRLAEHGRTGHPSTT